jgi:hypothetical protein
MLRLRSRGGQARAQGYEIAHKLTLDLLADIFAVVRIPKARVIKIQISESSPPREKGSRESGSSIHSHDRGLFSLSWPYLELDLTLRRLLIRVQDDNRVLDLP